MRTSKMKLLSIALILLLPGTGLMQQANAEMVSIQDLANESSTERLRSDLDRQLTRRDVARQLETFGVDASEARARVASLSDAEVRSLHNRVGELPAGSGVLSTITLVLVILILLDVAGVTDVFPKI